MRILKTALIAATFGYLWHQERTIKALYLEIDRQQRTWAALWRSAR